MEAELVPVTVFVGISVVDSWKRSIYGHVDVLQAEVLSQQSLLQSIPEFHCSDRRPEERWHRRILSVWVRLLSPQSCLDQARPSKVQSSSSTGTTRVQQAFEDVPKPCKSLYRLGDAPNKCNDIYPAKPAYRGATLSILLPCYLLYSSSSTIVVVQLLTLPNPPGCLR